MSIAALCLCCDPEPPSFPCAAALLWNWSASKVDFTFSSDNNLFTPVPLLPGDTENELVITDVDNQGRTWTATFTFHPDPGHPVTVVGEIVGFSEFNGTSTSNWNRTCDSYGTTIPLTFTHPFISTSMGGFTLTIFVP